MINHNFFPLLTPKGSVCLESMVGYNGSISDRRNGMAPSLRLVGGIEQQQQQHSLLSQASWVG